jgi:dTDP-4-amino-4,6-dideoxygalactose transaminase
MSSTKSSVSELQPVPQMDLAGQFAAIGGEIRQAIDKVLFSQQFVLGEEGAALEREIAALCGVAHGVGVASGTDALILALRAVGVGAGHEVILPPFTFVATGSAVSALGAQPVFADIDPTTFNINATEISKRITPSTKAIVVVHLYGLAADMDAIGEVARKCGVPVIEDNAQAIGAAHKGQPTGSLGNAGCISFYPTKNLGAYGDAGMIVCNSPEMDTRLRTLRNHGQAARYDSVEPGWNSRLDEIQAAILRVKLRYLQQWQSARQAHANHYSRLLAGIPEVVAPQVPPGCEHVYHQYTIRAQRRDELQKFLVERKIGAAVYYPIPLHLQRIYAGSTGFERGSLPHAEKAAREALSLPMFPELRAEQIERVAATISEFYGK